jgi:hypothetical protein
MNGSTSIARRTAVAALAGLTLSLLAGAAGCSSAGTAAATAAKAAAAQVATSAASTAAATVATNASVAVSTAPQSIWGRWVRKGPVINLDGSLSSGVFSVLVFRRNGSFMNESRAGVTATISAIGSFRIVGNVLTTNIGRVQQTVTYRIKGSELAITNPKSHQTVVFQRG